MRRRALLPLLACPLLIAACGDSGEGTQAAPPEPKAASPASFPAVKAGQSIAALQKGRAQGPIMALAVNTLKVGTNRVAFVLVDRARKQIDVDAAAVYTADARGRGVQGPFVAHKESLDVQTQYRSKLTAGDLANGKTFYVARVPFKKDGPQSLMGMARLDGRNVVAGAQGVRIGAGSTVPDIGQKAIRMHTQTATDVGGDYGKISTRVPPPKQMLSTDFSSVVGKKPVVLQFATPALCASRTCGPVVDIAEQVRATSGKGVTFIQQEVYKDNDVNKGLRPQMADWHLQTEPWTFVIDRRGRISSRFEGIFSEGELARAVAKVQGRS